MNKEQVYDEKIFPLMAQIVAICQKHGISMVANFDLPIPENDTLGCITALPDGKGVTPEHHKAAIRVLKQPEPQFAAFIVTTRGS